MARREHKHGVKNLHTCVFAVVKNRKPYCNWYMEEVSEEGWNCAHCKEHKKIEEKPEDHWFSYTCYPGDTEMSSMKGVTAWTKRSDT